MTDVLDERIRSMLDEVVVAAPPPPAFEELSGTTATGGRRRAALAGAAALVVVVGITGLVAVGRDADAPGPRPVSTDGPPVPATTTAPNPTASTTTAPTTSVVPDPAIVDAEVEAQQQEEADLQASTTVSATDVAAGLDERLGEVVVARRAALRALPGYRGTASPVFEQDVATDWDVPIDEIGVLDLPTERTNAATVLASGSFWSDNADGGWGSYDPATATIRGVFTGLDGTLNADVIVGQRDGSTAIHILMGHDPAQSVEHIVGNVVAVEDVEFDGRPAWSIVSSRDDERIRQDEHLVIDVATGLVVLDAVRFDQPDGTTTFNRSILTDLEIVSELPAGFPGVVPAEAVVRTSGDPDAVRNVSAQEADDYFGDGDFAVPADLPDDATITIEDYVAVDSPFDFRMVGIRIPDGFTPTFVTFSKRVPIDGAAIPTGEIVVDGALCGDADGDGVCDRQVQHSVVEDGALAGFDVQAQPAGFFPSDARYLGDGRVSVFVSTQGDADALIASLQRVGG